MDNNEDEMEVVVNTKEYAQSVNVTSAPSIFLNVPLENWI